MAHRVYVTLQLTISRVIASVFLSIVVVGCATSGQRESSQSQTDRLLESLGVQLCGTSGVHHSFGDGIGNDFIKYYRSDKGCTDDVYWYRYTRKEDGRAYAYAGDLDLLNNSLRRLSNEGKIVEILSGPNLLTDEQQDSVPVILTFSDPRYEPGAIPPATENVRDDVGSIAGTVWDASEPPDLVSAFYFDDQGAMRIHDSSGLHTNASWKQEGSTIFIEMNDHYVEHYGTVDGDTMRGNSWNASGRRWTWVATRRRSAD